MDWDGSRRDIKDLAKEARKHFPNAIGWMFAFRFRFISDVSAGEGEDRWVSIPFSDNLKQQIINANDYAGVFLSGRMNYGVVIPLEATIIVQEGKAK